MVPADLITESRVLSRCEVASKKRLLETLAGLLAEGDGLLSGTYVFDRLLERERLGSTGLGMGVALPHARMHGIQAPIGAFVQLRDAVAFDAIDDKPVDLAFGLLVPDATDEQHLQLLATLAAAFDDAAVRNALREAAGSAELLGVFRHRVFTA
ncbi:MAG: PTS sugar transporter subunit IIA [Thiohalocapsa sp.]|jgi:PTS system nitrogen regulatory IIA component|uniref:PTS sugar transporter subunit IIA n=1 Tax=Thiohalocapsa sp. TaxID=2497641 RepID=UPI0025DF7C7A|nr:PTS sugar transporter subunit IIA [Thiohalocapsa sp.]